MGQDLLPVALPYAHNLRIYRTQQIRICLVLCRSCAVHAHLRSQVLPPAALALIAGSRPAPQITNDISARTVANPSASCETTVRYLEGKCRPIDLIQAAKGRNNMRKTETKVNIKIIFDLLYPLKIEKVEVFFDFSPQMMRFRPLVCFQESKGRILPSGSKMDKLQFG